MPSGPTLDEALLLRLDQARHELDQHLSRGIVPFWLTRAIDVEQGGYFTNFDGDGDPKLGDSSRYIVSQARLLWTFSRLARAGFGPTDRLLAAAGHGYAWLTGNFRDVDRGGWYWHVDRSGVVLDDAKLTYGQSFAIYAIAEYARASGSDEAWTLAVQTMDDVTSRAFDRKHGGYLENLDGDWQPLPGGAAGGDRKSLDIHLHLLEAFTGLGELTGDPRHLERLREIRDVILAHMIDPASGVGGCQFDLGFRPLRPIVISRTWVAERPLEASVVAPDRSMAQTSYSHNLELGWLLELADTVLGEAGRHHETIVRLGEHALRWGTDPEYGGVYREGPFVGPATDTDKEFWQNAEALPGYLQAYSSSGDPRYLGAFLGVWDFARRHLINTAVGEWHTRTTRTGEVVSPELGSPWKVSYHTGRAAMEAIRRLGEIGDPSSRAVLSGGQSNRMVEVPGP